MIATLQADLDLYEVFLVSCPHFLVSPPVEVICVCSFAGVELFLSLSLCLYLLVTQSIFLSGAMEKGVSPAWGANSLFSLRLCAPLVLMSTLSCVYVCSSLVFVCMLSCVRTFV